MTTEIANEDGTLNEKKADAVIAEILAKNAKDDDSETPVSGDAKTNSAAGDAVAKVLEAEASDKDEKDDKAEKTPASEEGKDEVPENLVTPWTTDQDVQDYLATLGLTAESLQKDFADKDDFLLYQARRDKELAREAQSKREADAKAGKPEPQAVEDTAKPEETSPERQRDDKGRFLAAPYKLALSTDKYDEGTVGDLQKEFTGLESHLRQRIDPLLERLGKMEQFILQQQQVIEEDRSKELVRQFNATIDELGHPDLFGKTEEIHPGTEAWKARAAVWEHVGQLIDGSILHGRQFSPAESKAFVRRSVNALYADQLIKKTTKAKLDAIRRQSGRRLGSGDTTTQRVTDSVSEREAQLLRYYDELAEKQNGPR